MNVTVKNPQFIQIRTLDGSIIFPAISEARYNHEGNIEKAIIDKLTFECCQDEIEIDGEPTEHYNKIEELEDELSILEDDLNESENEIKDLNEKVTTLEDDLVRLQKYLKDNPRN